MVRVGFAVFVMTVLLSSPFAGAQSTAQGCPVYVAELQRARASLVGGDRSATIAALRQAQRALAECIRRESESAGAPVLLASAP